MDKYQFTNEKNTHEWTQPNIFNEEEQASYLLGEKEL